MQPKGSCRDEEYYCTGCSVTFDLETQEYRTSHHHNYFFHLLVLSALMVTLVEECYCLILREYELDCCFWGMNCMVLGHYHHVCTAAYFHSNK